MGNLMDNNNNNNNISTDSTVIPEVIHPFISDNTLRRLKLLSDKTRELNSNPRAITPEVRAELSLMFAITFRDFSEFCYVTMKFLGFSLTKMQHDISMYMQHGARLSMVMAQRGEAKSTIADIYAVWSLIQEPTHRIMIVSAGETLAKENAVLIIRIIETWHLLCWMRGDSSAKDRTSFEAYDIHHTLKGLDKSPSITCIGITAALAGKRADLVIADDIENNKAEFSAIEREKVLATSKEFSSICIDGKILYLGTPHTKNSMYNTLESRGIEVRIWCGRIPSVEQEERYGERLAPYIKDLIQNGWERTGYGLDGTLGASTDSERYTEEMLCEKEQDRGIEGFQLQYMLDTTMSDELRTKIKLSDLIIYSGDTNYAPNNFVWSGDRRYLYTNVPEMVVGVKMYVPMSVGDMAIPYSDKIMVIDPASKNDELAFSCGGSASSWIHLFSVGGLQGGLSTANIDYLLDKCIDMDIHRILIESNMGHGTVTNLFINRINERQLAFITVGEIYNTVQKERRIIDTISPITRRHRLVIHVNAIEDDTFHCMKYSREKRNNYSCFRQIQDISYDRSCLPSDDRIDTLAMMCQQLSATLIEDAQEASKKALQEDFKKFMSNPMDVPEYRVIGDSRGLDVNHQKEVDKYRSRMRYKQNKRNFRKTNRKLRIEI